MSVILLASIISNILIIHINAILMLQVHVTKVLTQILYCDVPSVLCNSVFILSYCYNCYKQFFNVNT